MTAPLPNQGRHRTVHGVTVGILMLDTKFQRVPGDIGYGPTFPFPVQYAVVRGAVSHRILRHRLEDEIIDAFLKAADDLVALGVDGITTSCGFLALAHPHLVAHCPVPVATSSLLQIPLVQQVLPKGKRVGVLTMDKDMLTPAHFAAVGAPADLPVAGIPPDGKWRENHRTHATRIDPTDHEREVLAIAGDLLRDNPDIGAFVLECTNMPPYSAALEAAFGLPVYDIVTLVEWFHGGLKPRRFPR